MKIHIFYRHYNIKDVDGRNRPSWFNYQNCYRNLLDTTDTGGDNFRINIVYDGDEYNWIHDVKYHKMYNILAGSDMESFFETCKLVKRDDTIQPRDLIYFLENDYMHVDNWLPKIIELFSTYQGLDYVSLYDHNDKYFLPIYDNLVSKIITTSTHHWRTTPSTCGSFVVSKERFDSDFDILSTMEGDHNKWLWLNQNRSRSILTPIPGLSTHCMDGLLSPTINWNKL
jgi:hypothetical protein